MTDLAGAGEDMANELTPGESEAFQSIFSRMLALAALAMPPRIEHDKQEDEETQR